MKKKKNIEKWTNADLFISAMGLIRVKTSYDVMDNLEIYIRLNFPLGKRGEIFGLVQKTFDEYHDQFLDKSGRFDKQKYDKIYSSPDSYKDWREKSNTLSNLASNPKMMAVFLDTFFQSYMISDRDIQHEFIKREWEEKIYPLFETF